MLLALLGGVLPVAGQTAHLLGATTTLGSGFNQPGGVAVDGSGNVYVADSTNYVVKKIPYSNGSYGTPVTVASGFTEAYGVAVDGSGNVYVASVFSNLMKIPYSNGSYGTPVPLGVFNHSHGVAVDGSGNVYVADSDNNAVKKIPYSNGSYGTPVTLGSFSFPVGVAVDGSGNVYVGATNNNAVKRIPYSNGSYGTPVTLGSGFNKPSGVVVDGSGNVYVADTSNNAVKKIELTIDLGSAAVGSTAATQTVAFSIDTAGTLPALSNLDVVTQGTSGLDFTLSTGSTCTGTVTAGQTCTVNVAFTPTTPGLRLGAVNLTNTSGAVLATAFLTGTGPGPLATFTPGVISTVAGTGTRCSSPVRACGDGSAATAPGANLYYPWSVALDGAGNLYIADNYDHRIRKVTAATGILSTAVGGGTSSSSTEACDDGSAAGAGSSLYYPSGVAVDGAGNLYIADTFDYRIRKVTAATGILSTVAGTGIQCASSPATYGDGGAATAVGANLNAPRAAAVDIAATSTSPTAWTIASARSLRPPASFPRSPAPAHSAPPAPPPAATAAPPRPSVPTSTLPQASPWTAPATSTSATA